MRGMALGIVQGCASRQAGAVAGLLKGGETNEGWGGGGEGSGGVTAECTSSQVRSGGVGCTSVTVCYNSCLGWV